MAGAASLYTCNAGLYCDRTTERCRPKKPSGEACEGSHDARGQATPNLQWQVGLDALRETLPSRRSP